MKNIGKYFNKFHNFWIHLMELILISSERWYNFPHLVAKGENTSDEDDGEDGSEGEDEEMKKKKSTKVCKRRSPKLLSDICFGVFRNPMELVLKWKKQKKRKWKTRTWRLATSWARTMMTGRRWGCLSTKLTSYFKKFIINFPAKCV